MSRHRHHLPASLLGIAALGLALALSSASPFARQAAQERPWIGYSSAADGSRFFPNSQITKGNVTSLEVAWTYPFSDTVSTPMMARGTIFGRGRNGALVALDARTGKEIWVREGMDSMTQRGINYWESADGSDRRLLFSMNDYLQAIDARTGKLITTFGDNGAVDLREGLGRDPATINRIQSQTPGQVFENLLLLGSAPGEGYMSAPGHVRAFDVVTGKQVWRFNTIPQPGEFGYDTWPPDAYKYVGAVNTWGELSVDVARGIAYFPTGSPTYDYYGADRPGSNLYGTSLLALDARTGKRIWHFQLVHHDLWDFDTSSAPQLTTIVKDGQRRDVVAVAGKSGFLYVFDRVTGEPIWPIEERPVPVSGMPGEKSWPTQPFPTVVPPFSKLNFTEDDINPFNNITPEEREAFRERVRGTKNQGMFTPIDFIDTLHIPGSNGGSVFGTAASEPGTGIVYVIGQNNPGILRLMRSGEPRNRFGGPATPGEVVYQRDCASCHGPNRAGTDAAPSLAGVAERFDEAALRSTVTSGKGRMPAFPHLTDVEMAELLVHLRTPVPGPRGRAAFPAPVYPPGPVVGSGGARTRTTSGRGGVPARPVETPYPEGVSASPQYTINEYGTIGRRMKPPYTTITKYDLNIPAIVWQVGFGDDPELAEKGMTGTGMPQMRNGAVVTDTGLYFAAAGDNKVRAYDTANGTVVWTGHYGGTYRGAPIMYAIDGRQYLLVPAAGDRLPAGNQVPPYGNPPGPLGYVAFALPK
jgi:quinoprotein glucose dehydrogenase